MSFSCMNLQPPWPTAVVPCLIMFTSETRSLPINLLSPSPIHQVWVLAIPGYKAGVWRIATLYLSALVANFLQVASDTNTTKPANYPGINLELIS